MNDNDSPKQKQFHLAQTAALASGPAGVLNPSLQNPITYIKDVLSSGSFKAGAGAILKVSAEKLKKIIADSNRYLKNGNSIEYIANHSGPNNKPFDKFENNTANQSVTNIGGYCGNFSEKDDWAQCEIAMTTEGGVKLAQSTKDVSIELAYDYEDTKGNKYEAVIRRVAAVQKPVVPGQSGYSLKLSEQFADTETFVLITNNQEESEMSDENKGDKKGLNDEDLNWFHKFKKAFTLSEDADDDKDKAAKDKAAQLTADLEASQKELADEKKKSAKATKELETSAIASLVGAAKTFAGRISKLNIDQPSKDKLVAALGIDENPEKMNKVFLSEDEDGKSFTNVMIEILENIELLSTSEKTLKLSEYHSKSDETQKEEDAKWIKEKAASSKQKLGLGKQEVSNAN